MTRRWKNAAAGVLLAVAVMVAPTPPVAALNLYVISGTVFSGERGRPGVTVTDGERTIVTGPSGTFRFERSLPGVVFVTASIPGGPSRTWVVVLTVPGETVVEFSFPYYLALWGPGLWDPMSTAAGPVTRSLPIATDAPDPGSPGEVGRTCVSVFDSRNSTTTAGRLDRYSSGLWEWRWELSLPQATPEGDYFIDMILADCGTGARLTDGPETRPYKIDNSPPEASDPSPTGWVGPSTVVSARVVDAAGSLHPDIDDHCFRPVRLWIDGSRYFQACFERRGSAERLYAAVSGLSHGLHAAEVRASDDAGNEAPSVPFSFSVDAHPPVLADPSPVGVIADTSPAISIAVSEPDSGVDPSSVEMRLSNGAVISQVDARYDPLSRRVTYQVPERVEGAELGRFPLPDGSYRVVVGVDDEVANHRSFSWVFEVRATIPGG